MAKQHQRLFGASAPQGGITRFLTLLFQHFEDGGIIFDNQDRQVSVAVMPAHVTGPPSALFLTGSPISKPAPPKSLSNTPRVPPWSLMIRCTMNRPSPLPRPIGLVVKKGSKT